MTYSNYDDAYAQPTDQGSAPLSQPLYGATLVQAVQRFFKKYFRFSGYASRSEFWWVFLCTALYSVAVEFLRAFGPETVVGVVNFLILLILLVPSLALGARRLHDVGLSAGFLFLNLIPFIGSIILLVLYALPTNEEKHRADWDDESGD